MLHVRKAMKKRRTERNYKERYTDYLKCLYSITYVSQNTLMWTIMVSPELVIDRHSRVYMALWVVPRVVLCQYVKNRRQSWAINPVVS